MLSTYKIDCRIPTQEEEDLYQQGETFPLGCEYVTFRLEKTVLLFDHESAASGAIKQV